MLANLKAAIAARGMQQIDLCERLGIFPTTLSAIIRERKEAAPELRQKIAYALNCDELWLFTSVRLKPMAAARDESSETKTC